MAVFTPLLEGLNAIKGRAGSLTWGPFVHLARSAVLSILQRIEIGHLEITESNGVKTVCGNLLVKHASPTVTLQVHNEMFWIRVLLFADMGFAESYMLEEISCIDLTSFFKLFILNRTHLSNGSTITSNISGSISGLVRKTNTLTNARLHISAHYDISNDMFAAFLSPDMTYSCPIWLPKSSPLSATESLEEAQMRKLHHFIESAHLKESDHVLEIGTGWGSLAIEAVRATGCRITSLTLSKEQKELAEERIAQAGFQDKIDVLLCDYRDVQPPAKGAFDKVVSIEMLEAVGKEFLETYFSCVNRLLKKEGGIGVFQCITMPETRYDAYASSDDFIRRYIFPGGHLPTVSQLVNAINTGSNKTLIVDDVLNIGPHYAKTLRLWREAFLDNFDADIRPALLRQHDGMTKQEIETFRRKWEYYFTYCEAGFWTKTLGDVIITVGREGTMEMAEDVPM
ncbi:cyclopropane-fatty-acyl-phospholipid synthase [Pseudovirgaria hyperparasitica]|uniref:Cyclopropane-fatty-acyl-phospholipid synthase n=1 Tax=Pseudovirgaria hyperparasitica TaxID=470096 RepID=A0A6A6VUV6_9PEZI|nr:cyclopropane-fatty-acyl-phospholipid synthase [Pseudovirgaria hyperparasitica]KAF2753047.1 cyclopropane-fatty-acyl-phospholipid synthase [Pseudovirgaria hyperparasitica]